MKYRRVLPASLLCLAGVARAQTAPATAAPAPQRETKRQNVPSEPANNNMADQAALMLRSTDGSLLQAQLAVRAGPAQVQPSQVSFFAVPEPPPKLLKKHDLVTIVVDEESTISSKGTNNMSRDSELDAKVNDFVKFSPKNLTLTGLQATTTPEINLSGIRSFQGSGEVDRSDSFIARITAEVVDVKPNGTIILQARERIKSDEEEQQLILTGTCRAEDVTAANSVLSSQLFDLQLQKNHKGDVRQATRRSTLGKLLDIFNPF